MMKARRVSAVGAIALAGLLLALAVAGGQAAAAPPGLRTTFVYLIATDFLCDLDPSACPAFATADNGDTIEVTGAGRFDPVSKVATGGGRFIHRDASGNVLGAGEWRAVRALSFASYGSGAVQGFPPELYGGQLILRVHLAPDAAPTPGFLGVLTVGCLLGDKIPGGAYEGVRLNVGEVINFNRAVSGFTVYIRT